MVKQHQVITRGKVRTEWELVKGGVNVNVYLGEEKEPRLEWFYPTVPKLSLLSEFWISQAIRQAGLFEEAQA